MSLRLSSAAVLLGLLVPLVVPVQADEPAGDKRIFVPVEDLDAVFDQHGSGVLLPRAEFEKLAADAKKQAGSKPQSAQEIVVSQAKYAGKLDGEHLVVQATVDFQQFARKWAAAPLPFEGLSVEAATMDGKPARLGPGLQLFSSEPGRHTLNLDLSARLVNVGSDQVAAFKLPVIPVASMTVPVPAGKFLQVNEVALERPAAANMPAEYTVALGGTRDVVLKITDQQAEQATKSLVFANIGIGVHVAPDELTWRAVANLQVFGQPVDTLSFLIPKSLEIISVESTGLERWEIGNGPDAATTALKLIYRQAFKDGRAVTFQGVQTTVVGQPWSVPTLKLQQATSQTSSVLVQHPGSLRLQVVEVDGARRVGADELKGDMPDMAKPVSANQQLHFAAWTPDFTIQIVTQPKSRELQASIVTKLDLNAREVTLVSSVIVQARFAPLFEVSLTLPADWTPSEVLVKDQPAVWQVSPVEAGTNRVRVPLNPPLAPDASVSLKLTARRIPAENWPPDDAAPLDGQPGTALELPEVRLEQASVTEGTYQIAGDEDLEFTLDDLVGLDPAPISAQEQQSARPPRLAYDYQDTRFSGVLHVTRKPTRTAALVLGYHRLDQRTVFSHLEARLLVQGSGLRTILLFVSEAAGEALQFELAGGPARIVEQTANKPQNGFRLWTLQLDQRTAGLLHLVAQVQNPRPAQGKIAFPMLRVGNADRHDVYLAVEGHPDQQLVIDAKDAAGQNLTPFDPPDLPAPVGYFPEQRIVAAYHTVDADGKLSVTDSRFERVAVPTAICDRCDLTTVLGQAGEAQHKAVFQIRAVGVQSLNLRLPEGATLWATLLDETPIEVRRQEPGVYAVPLTDADGTARSRTLEILYRQTRPALGLSGDVEQTPPTLTALSGQGTAQPVEILQRKWSVITPSDVEVVDAKGAFEPVGRLNAQSFLMDVQRLVRIGNSSEALFKLGIVGVATMFVFVTWTIIGRIRRTRRVAVLEILCGLVILSILIAVSLPAVQQSRDIWRDIQAIAPPPTSTADFDDGGERYGKYVAGAKGVPARFGDGSVTTETTATEAMEELDATVQDQTGTMADSDAFITQTVPAPPVAGVPSVEAKPEAKDEPSQDLSSLNKSLTEGRMDEKKAEAKGQAERRTNELQTQAEVDGRKGRGAGERKPRSRPPGLLDGAAAPEKQPAQPPQAGNEIAAQNPAGPAGGGQPGKPAAPKPEVGQGVRDGTSNTLGLLSLKFDLAAPAGTVVREFTYVGSPRQNQEPVLHFGYLHRGSLGILRAIVAMIVVLACWILRRAALSVRVSLVVLALAVPLGLTPVVPLKWLPVLDGVFLGGVFGLLLLIVTAWSGSYAHLGRPQRRGILKPWMNVVLAFACLAIASAQAQEKPNENPAAPPPPMPAQKIPVVIPYDPATDPLKAERVLLPYDKFLELWNAANPDKPKVGPAPVEGLVAEALYSAKFIPAAKTAPAQVEVTARFAVHNLQDRQITLPLPLAKVPLASAKLDGQSAPLVDLDAEGGKVPAVILMTAGPHVVDLTFRLAAEQTGDAGKFTLPLKPVPAGSLRFTLPNKDVSLKVAGGSGTFRKSTQGNETVAIVPVAAGGDVAVSWAPARTKDNADAIVQVDSVTAVHVADAALNVSAGFRYVVRQGAISEAAFTVPAGVQVKRISGPDVGGWTPPADQEPRTLTVSFRRAVNDSTQLIFELYSPLTIGDMGTTVTVPAFAPTGVTRETGTVAVYTDPHLAVSPGTTVGLAQTDIGKFAAVVDVPRPGTSPLLVYRHVTRPFTLPLIVSRQKPVTKGIAEHAVLVAPRKVKIKSRIDLTLTGAPRSEVVIQLPIGYLLSDVASPDVGDWSVQKKDDLTPPLLRLELTSPRTGRVEFLLDGVVPKTPEDDTASFAPPYPLDVQDLRSAAAVWVDSLYVASLSDFPTWKSVDPETISPKLRSARPQALQFAFTSSSNTPDAISLSLTRAVPGLSADTLAVAIVQETQVEYVLALQWKIDRAAETRFMFTLPDWLAGPLDVYRGQGPTRVRQVLTQKLDGGRTRYTLITEEPQRERYFVTARAVLAPPKLPPAPQTARIEAPAVLVEQKPAADADPQVLPGQRSYLMLVNQSPWQVDTADANLVDSIPAEELPIKVRQEWINQAGEVQRLKAPASAGGWTVRPVQTVQSLPASVNLMEIRMALARDGSWRTRTVFKVNNRARQFLGLRLPEGSTILSLFVQNLPARPVNATASQKPVTLVPMPKTAAGDLSAEVQLVYEGRFANDLPKTLQLGFTRLDLPAPHVLSQEESAQFGAPVSRTEWTVSLPPDVEAIRWDDATRTNMTQSVAGYDRIMAELGEQLQLIDDSKSMFNFSQKMRAYNNRKQLSRETIQNYTNNSELTEAQRKEVETRYEKLQAAQQAEAAQPEQKPSEGRPAEEDIEQSLRFDNPVAPQNKESEGEALGLQLEKAPESKPSDEKKKDGEKTKEDQSNRRIKLRQQAKGQSESLNAPAMPQPAEKREGQQGDPNQPYSITAGSRSLPRGRSQQLVDRMKTKDAERDLTDRDNYKKYGDIKGIDTGTPEANSIMGGGTRLNNKSIEDVEREERSKGRAVQGVQDDELRDLDIPFQQGAFPIGKRGEGRGPQQRQGQGAEGVLIAQGDRRMVRTSGSEADLRYAAGGLSLPIEIPQGGHSLTFSKVGGEPRLSLGIRPRASLELWFGLAWTAVCAVVAVSVLTAFRGPAAVRKLSGQLPLVLAAVGLLWFFTIPAGAWLGFALFLISASLFAWRRTTPIV